MTSRLHPKTPVSFLIGREGAVFAENLFLVRNSGRLISTVRRVMGSISMTLW